MWRKRLARLGLVVTLLTVAAFGLMHALREHDHDHPAATDPNLLHPRQSVILATERDGNVLVLKPADEARDPTPGGVDPRER